MGETESQTSYFGTDNLSVYDHPHSFVPKKECKATLKKENTTT